MKVEGGGEGRGWGGVRGGVDVVVFDALVAAGGVGDVGGVLVLLGELLCCWFASREATRSVRVFKSSVVAGWMVGLVSAVSAEALAEVARAKMSSSFSPTVMNVFLTSVRASSMSVVVPVWARLRMVFSAVLRILER